MSRHLSIGCVALVLVSALTTDAFAQLASPGFELGPSAAVTPFPQTSNSMVWRASHTDGERMQGTALKPAASGQYYASLLQNAGAGPATALPFASFGFTGYDRIFDTFSVLPNSTYTVSFQQAGDDIFGYMPGTTVITVGAADNSAVFAHILTPTPGLFNWTSFSFNFTTDAVTTTAAIAFATRATFNSSLVIDDVAIASAIPPSVGFCLGDGSGTACPCANTGAAGHGCASSAYPGGAILSAFGFPGASAGTDTLVLKATDIPGPGLFFQANGLLGSPANFGDGLLCAGSGIIRMGVVFPTANQASYPGGSTANAIHLAGGPISPGDIKHYQCWYRDAPVFCLPATFNLTQGLTLTWGP